VKFALISARVSPMKATHASGLHRPTTPASPTTRAETLSRATSDSVRMAGLVTWRQQGKLKRKDIGP